MNVENRDDTRLKLASRLKEARKAAGLTQGHVAKMVNLHRPTISEIEAGNRRVTSDELKVFADIYDVTVSWLVGETEESLNIDDPRLQLAARELSKLNDDDLERLLRLLASMRDSSK
ncbi:MULTISPECIES: helix-turn-helix domain-containing protein [Acinetobacter calcoaceticus/baumannii complex]|uniref:helix-turn-helix domain-containing protein n=1 Tax=Acinetobacter calcoaceticus/baumannii complex TaxID=909768 RepID=UPI000451F49B|nr:MULTISPECIES: helix-turn-helix transcriptional regulator [Acinetobacter calcoaceticus/baumannii complex]EXA84052.1 helix-turn-helix family protein [Acinetobacter baumannii 1267820]MBP1488974.1 helix-turn-helix transcriptional regulator [Acinetobacter nosocomialis]MDQ8998582.1 helix-turn-helix transcriptional regulator [Acinetobacter baumannii]MDQ9001977.1 helix-turn-helix transcriptional regulator [Acinetobacter baumannii]HEN9527996.1 helix-turn-helix transcriptional regulator [Acinetobacte